MFFAFLVHCSLLSGECIMVTPSLGVTPDQTISIAPTFPKETCDVVLTQMEAMADMREGWYIHTSGCLEVVGERL